MPYPSKPSPTPDPFSGTARVDARRTRIVGKGGSRREVILSPEAEAQVEPKMQAMGVTTFRALVEGMLMRPD